MFRIQFEIPADHAIYVSMPDQRPHRPIPDHATFFYDQMTCGLRFPIPPFFQDLANYYNLNLSQLAPNSYRLIYGTIIICRLYQILLTLTLFNALYDLR